MLKFNYKDFIIFLILFIIEVQIALYAKQHFIRHVIGDFLVVIMLYYFLKSFLKVTSLNIALIVLLFSYFIEFMQLINILDILNFQKNTTLRIIFGTTFSMKDLITYTLGVCTVFIIEKYLKPLLSALSS